MAVDRKRVEELLQYRGERHPVVSLYLNVTPPRNFITELKSLVSTSGAETRNRNIYDEDQLLGLERTFEDIENYVHHLGRLERTRLLVIFADAEGLWQEYRLPVALPSRVLVEYIPYSRPLTMLLEESERHCVLITDARKARIFTLYLGEFEEHPDVFIESEVPDRVRASLSMAGSPATGVRGGVGEERIRRHIEDHIHRHLKYVADETLRFFKEKGFDLLIVAGPEDKILPWLKDHLHSYLRNRLVGEFHAHPENREDELKEKALQAVHQYKRRHEEQLIEQLLELRGPGGKAVFGIEPTLEALMMGQVHTLVIQNDFQAEGFVCPRDRILSTYLESCPLCQQPMHRSGDLAEEMVQEALSQSAEIEHVFTEHEEFKPHGIGALLRFTI